MTSDQAETLFRRERALLLVLALCIVPSAFLSLYSTACFLIAAIFQARTTWFAGLYADARFYIESKNNG